MSKDIRRLTSLDTSSWLDNNCKYPVTEVKWWSINGRTTQHKKQTFYLYWLEWTSIPGQKFERETDISLQPEGHVSYSMLADWLSRMEEMAYGSSLQHITSMIKIDKQELAYTILE
jgi:hypothetical protein